MSYLCDIDICIALSQRFLLACRRARARRITTGESMTGKITLGKTTIGKTTGDEGETMDIGRT